MNLKDLTEEKADIDAYIKKMQNHLETNNIPLTVSYAGVMSGNVNAGTTSSKIDDKISQHEITDSQQQLAVMKQYSEILQRRINRL